MYTIYEVMLIWLVAILTLWTTIGIRKFFKTRTQQVKGNGGRTSKCDDRGLLIALSVISGIIALLVGYSIANSRESDLPTKTVVTNVKELAAFRSSDSISGSIFLGCGYVEGIMMYNMYVRNADGSMSPDHVEADPSIRLVEDKSLKNKGYWKVIEVRRDRSVPQAKWALADDDDVVSSSYEFDVPVGTVSQNFSAK